MTQAAAARRRTVTLLSTVGGLLRNRLEKLDHLLDDLRDSLEHGPTGARREVEAILIDLEYLAGDLQTDADWLIDDLPDADGEVDEEDAGA